MFENGEAQVPASKERRGGDSTVERVEKGKAREGIVKYFAFTLGGHIDESSAFWQEPSLNSSSGNPHPENRNPCANPPQ